MCTAESFPLTQSATKHLQSRHTLCILSTYKHIFICTNMKKPAISFEFFPPRSPVQERRFWSCFGALQTLNPEYVSMTWGALGTSSQASVDVLEGLTADSKVPLAAHLTCIGHTEKSIRQTIAMLDGLGIKRYVALRGDQPERRTDPELLQHASDLVAILAEDPCAGHQRGCLPRGTSGVG